MAHPTKVGPDLLLECELCEAMCPYALTTDGKTWKLIAKCSKCGFVGRKTLSDDEVDTVFSLQGPLRVRFSP